MPVESARMPGETHQSLLNHGKSKPIGLLANEIAFYRRQPRFFRTGRNFLQIIGAATTTAIIAFAIIKITSA